MKRLFLVLVLCFLVLVSYVGAQSRPGVCDVETVGTKHQPTQSDLRVVDKKARWIASTCTMSSYERLEWGGGWFDSPMLWMIAGPRDGFRDYSAKIVAAEDIYFWDQFFRVYIPNGSGVRRITFAYTPIGTGRAGKVAINLLVTTESDGTKSLFLAYRDSDALAITFGDNREWKQGEKIPLTLRGTVWETTKMALALPMRAKGDNLGKPEIEIEGAYGSHILIRLGATIYSDEEPE